LFAHAKKLTSAENILLLNDIRREAKEAFMYKVTDDGKFIVENYNWQTSFSNFFPGIAGKYGIPMWAYYVSRKQALISLGVRDKNHPILEFRSFNKALAVVGDQGFRTFYKIKDKVFEPFCKSKERGLHQTLTLSSSDLELLETNTRSGITTQVRYFMLVNTGFPGFVRQVTLTNTSTRSLTLELIDGLPRILPYGVDLHGVNTIARHIEGMMEVAEVAGTPLFRLKQTPADTEKVGKLEGGNFYLATGSAGVKLNYIVDPQVVFGEAEIYDTPWVFQDSPLNTILREPQVKQNQTPCALTASKITLRPNKSVTISAVIGYAADDKSFKGIMRETGTAGYYKKKHQENEGLIEGIKGSSLTISDDCRFDRFCEQNFLDNVIRGGMPTVFSTARNDSAFYLYSRQNGDLERDYHQFVVEPTYFSQGTGHYRSVNQNRRCDAWFFPEVKDSNISSFMNLIQLDAYNPLEITQLTYTIIRKKEFQRWLQQLTRIRTAQKELTDRFAERSFAPGEFIMALEELQVKTRKDNDTVLQELLAFAEEDACGAVHEGFWVDHWFYNLDLIDTYLMIFPDRLKQLLIDNQNYYFFDDPDVIQPRTEKYMLVNGQVRQYDAVVRDPQKEETIASRRIHAHRARTRQGQGEVYYTNLMVKLLCLVVNRMATLDPENIGIEMEADKPGWNDSMNGLPGLLGSSLCETLELEKALSLLANSCVELETETIKVYQELYDFMTALEKCIEKRLKGRKKEKTYIFWDESHTLKEKYLEKIKYGLAGKEVAVPLSKLGRFLGIAQKLIAEIYTTANRKKVFNASGVPYTYFINEVTAYKVIPGKVSKNGSPLVKPTKFKQQTLPLFLEGAVHMLKVHPELREKIYSGVRKSRIFDKKLKMYKVCEPLKTAPFEIGRVQAWGPGWIENESVYTHMLYKYLLELIKSGLYDEFYRDIKTMLSPWFEPGVYGRSPFENVSFIVSSAFPAEALHGRGLQPRLSGVTGEMINIWVLMVAGRTPFFLDDGQLCFALRPALPDWLFTRKQKEVKVGNQLFTLPKNTFFFKLFNRIEVTYHNRQRKNTYGKGGATVAQYRLYYRNSQKVDIAGSVIKAPYSYHLREGEIVKMEVILK